MRNKIKYLLIIFVAIIFSLSLAEGIIRLSNFFGHKKRCIYLPDPFTGHRHSSSNNFVFQFHNANSMKQIPHKTNRFGFIGTEISFRKEKGTQRIVVMGDSFTEAFQVPDDKNFCNLLRDNLKATNTKSHYEIINAGLSGFSPIAMITFWEHDIRPLNPDLVIIQLFSNDVFEDHKTSAMSIMDEHGFPVRIHRYFTKQNSLTHNQSLSKLSLLEKWCNWLVEHSRLFELIVVKSAKAQKNNKLNKKFTSLQEFNDGYQFFINDEHSPLHREHKFRDKALPRSIKYLNFLVDSIQANHTKVLILYIPAESQLNRDEKMPKYGSHSTMFNDYQLGAFYNQALAVFTNLKKIPFLDLLPQMEKYKDQGLYWDEDGHLTERGHQIVAEALSSKIQEMLKTSSN